MCKAPAALIALITLGALCALASLHGCASSTPGIARTEVQTLVGSVSMLGAPYVKVVEGARDRVFEQTVGAHRELGLTSGSADPATGTIEIVERTSEGEFAGEPVSRFLTCGADLAGRELADAGVVELSVLTVLRRAGDRWVEVRSQVGGMASPPGATATASAWRLCRSTGALEQRILAEVSGFPVVAEGVEGEVRVVDPAAAGEAGAAGLDVELDGGRAADRPEVPDAIRRAMEGFDTGDEIRLVLPWEWVSGTVLHVGGDEVDVRVGVRQQTFPFWAIQEVHARRERRSWGIPGAIAGGVIGAVITRATGLGISGDKPAQGRALNPWLGAIAGSLGGAGIGSLIGGDYWVTVARVPEEPGSAR